MAIEQPTQLYLVIGYLLPNLGGRDVSERPAAFDLCLAAFLRFDAENRGRWQTQRTDRRSGLRREVIDDRAGDGVLIEVEASGDAVICSSRRCAGSAATVGATSSSAPMRYSGVLRAGQRSSTSSTTVSASG